MPDTDPARELELALARERQAQETIDLMGRRLEEAERAGGRVAELELELREARAETERRAAEVEELQRVNRELEATAAHFREVNDGLMSSLSWRLTRPLRAVKGTSDT